MFPDLFQNDSDSDAGDALPSMGEDEQRDDYYTEYKLAISIVTKYVEKRCVYLVRRVVSQVRRLSSGGLSGEDSGLQNVWEEYVDQVQNEESIFFDQYVEMIEGVCASVVDKIPEHEVWLIWLGTAECLHQDDSELPAYNEVQDAVVQYLYSLVWSRAANEPLPKARQDYYDQVMLERFNDDRR